MYRFISSRTWVFFLHIHRVHGYMLLYFNFCGALLIERLICNITQTK